MQSPKITSPNLRFAHWLRQQTLQSDLDTKGQRTLADVKIATAKLLEQRGYNDFTMADIAAQAKISRPALYQYVPNKQALVLELLEDFYRFMSATLRGAKSGGKLGGNGADDLMAVNRAYVRFFAANARILVSIEQVRPTLKGAGKLQLDLNQRWAQKIARHIQKNTGRAAEPQADHALLHAYALEHMVDGLLTDIYVRKNPALERFARDPEAVADALSQIWLKAIEPGGAA